MLAEGDAVYEDMATKFLEHFALIAAASEELWDDEAGFYYDVVDLGDGGRVPLRVRSMVGLLPMAAATTLGEATLAKLPEFARRLQWFTMNKPDLAGSLTRTHVRDGHEGRLLAVVPPERLTRLLEAMLDEAEFLSPHGVRALSAYHRDHPFTVDFAGIQFSVDYEPGESTTDLFGGNSNWRGPVWFPVNHLLIEAVQRYARFFGDDVSVECPAGSGRQMTLGEVADELSRRLVSTFLDGPDGRRPVLRLGRAAADRPGAPRPVALQRVLPRRHRRRAGRVAPDRLDRPRRRAHRHARSAVKAAIDTSAVNARVTGRPFVGTDRP